MCGRFTLTTPLSQLKQQFEAEGTIEHTASYNIAPSQDVVVDKHENDSNCLLLMRWGLIPAWLRQEDISSKWINARAETITEKPLFSRLFKNRRCLIPSDGFYEWQQQGGNKQPFYIHKKSGEPFAFAGLWDQWRSIDGKVIESCTIITTEANDAIRPIHSRMPVILAKSQYQEWLQASKPESFLLSMLQPYNGHDLETYPVSTLVNKPSNSAIECIQPLAAKD
jgi:putative SOS response-associated peptidase YedK